MAQDGINEQQSNRKESHLEELKMCLAAMW